MKECYIRGMGQLKHQTKSVSPSNKLGYFFLKRRKELGLPSEVVASYLEIPVKTLALYEDGVTLIPLHHVYALSNCLNIAPDEIVKVTKNL
jgi:hypothetical protein